MTVGHLRDGIVPKYYLGTWVQVRSRTGKTRYKFEPWTNANGDFIAKKQYTERYVLMNDIPVIEERAQSLWTKIDVEIITLETLNEAQKLAISPEWPPCGPTAENHPFCMNAFYTDIPLIMITTMTIPRYVGYNHGIGGGIYSDSMSSFDTLALRAICRRRNYAMDGRRFMVTSRSCVSNGRVCTSSSLE